MPTVRPPCATFGWNAITGEQAAQDAIERARTIFGIFMESIVTAKSDRRVENPRTVGKPLLTR
jgi:hypothetical protein